MTGNRIQGHEKLPETIQDISWLVEKITQKGAIRNSNHIIKNDEFASFKNPISGWDLERIENEILLHLDPDCGYDEWLRVGQILHHQFNGDPEACDLWDQWSAESNKWVEGNCEEKWKTFKLAGNQSRGLLTLATLLQKTKSQRNSVAQKKRKAQLETYLQKINTCFDIQNIENDIAKEIASSTDLSDTEIEILGGAMQMRMKALGFQFPIAKIRAWLRPKPSAQTAFTHVSPDGHPLCTLENLRILLTQLGYVVRYNAIKKLIEIIIPDATFTRDNRDNAALARVLSECEKVRMPTKHVHQFLVTLADENLYNPVATWILSKPWDRRSRLKEFLATVQATGNQTLKDTLLRKWLIQAVAAAFAPDGLAAQGILTFVGPQNIGKTTWFQRLAPPELDVILTGHTLETRSKDSVFVALSFWIVELGEVDATIRKSDVAAFKSFITQPFDKIRRPYAATESNFGRRTVFGATVNDTYFLSDPTGNRRFWTIEVESFVLDHGIDIQQLWAEIYALWCNQEPFNLEPKDISALNEYNQDFSIIDPIEDRLTARLHWNSANNWDWKTVTEALLSVGVLNPTRQQVLTASRILMKLNGGRRRKSNGRILFAIPEEIEEFLL